MKLSIVIPVYNEKNTISEILKRVKKAYIGEIEKEIIVVDDGSTDGTGEILTKIADRNIRVILKKENRGKGHSLRVGFKYVSGDLILMQDADLEYDPQDYPRMLEPIISGKARVVYGERFTVNRKERWAIPSHYIGNKFLSFLTKILYFENITDIETGYKLFKKEIIKNLDLKSNKFNIEPEITAKILKKKYKIHEVPISYHPRTKKQGKKIGWKDGLVAVYTLLKYRFFD